MNRLDKAIAWASPSAGLRRQTARAQLGILEQTYDGARSGRRTDGWVTGSTSANAEIIGAGSRLSARSRDLVRNQPNIVSAKRNVRLYSVGTGIELQFGDARWQALFDDWVGEADAAGQLDFYGLQSLAAATIFESGSVILRRRGRRDEDGLSVPMQIELLEPDHLDTTRDATAAAGGYILNGIEFDALSRRRGYWLYPVHPGETGGAFWRAGAQQASTFVPANNVSHAFVVDRPGQVTGVPWTASVIMKARDLADYEEAELFRKKIEACNVGAVTQAGGSMGQALAPVAPGAPLGSGPGAQGGDPRPEQFEPGMFLYLQPGQDVTFNDPKGNTSYGDYVKTHLRDVGAGTGVPYDKITSDLSEANYSSLKAGSNQFEALMESFRWLTLIPNVCEPVVQWFMAAAELGGKAPGKRSEYEWQPPPYPEVDELKGASARLLDVRSGVKTMQQVIRSRGGDPARQLEQIRLWNESLDKANVVLDTDPRKVTRVGGVQPSDPNDNGAAE